MSRDANRIGIGQGIRHGGMVATAVLARNPRAERGRKIVEMMA